MEELVRVDDRKPYAVRHKPAVWPRDSEGMGDVYAPYVKPLNIDKVSLLLARELPNDPIRHEFTFTVAFLRDPSVHGIESPTKYPAKSTLSADEFKAVRAAGLLVKHDDQSAEPTVSAFARREMKKGKPRRRTIFHTVRANNTGKMPAKRLMRVNPYQTLFAICRRKRLTATRDFKSYYHQFEFGPAVGKILLVKHEDIIYRLTRAPMGHKAAAAAAHTTSKALTLLALARAGVDASRVNYDIIIDDVLFASNSEEDLRATLAAFDQVCEEVGATIGSGTEPQTASEHRGVYFDSTTNTRRLRASNIEKLSQRWLTYLQKQTFERARSLLGTAAFASQVLRFDLGRMMSLTLRAEINGAPVAPSDIAEFIDHILTNDPVENTDVESLPFGGLLIADATPVGWGALFITELGDVTTIAGTHGTLPIHVAEALATVRGLELLPFFDVPHRVGILTDNSVWLYTMVNSYSRIDALQDARSLFFSGTSRRNIFPTAGYIHTLANPTDGLSRGDTSVDDDKVRAAITAATFLVSKRGGWVDGEVWRSTGTSTSDPQIQADISSSRVLPRSSCLARLISS